MNIATTVQQSRELLALGADPDTADFRWQVLDKHNDSNGNLHSANYALLQVQGAKVDCEGNGELDFTFSQPEMRHDDVSAWSLQALIKLLPQGIEHEEYGNLRLYMQTWYDEERETYMWSCYYADLYVASHIEFDDRDLFNAVYDMVKHLQTQKND